jgi:hypothetical protein
MILPSSLSGRRTRDERSPEDESWVDSEVARRLLALTRSEIDLPDKLLADKSEKRPGIKTISHYLIKIARLGGYLARANDGPPGNKVIWRGLSRLTSVEFAVASG